ncbi:hypothetical protein MXM48_11685 [Mammaliicoccus sciuri]|uniref:hypothetical protein n=1 Tax=Mammaliicoccus sciuri TaxID=1296 RepID=UPI002DB99CF6|nr:hypothetical protein [Mammaliicoccus sciuri]MEB6207433.1 hypothetical protein [Mammaliicoccus sciuri]
MTKADVLLVIDMQNGVCFEDGRFMITMDYLKELTMQSKHIIKKVSQLFLYNMKTMV